MKGKEMVKFFSLLENNKCNDMNKPYYDLRKIQKENLISEQNLKNIRIYTKNIYNNHSNQKEKGISLFIIFKLNNYYPDIGIRVIQSVVVSKIKDMVFKYYNFFKF